MLVLDTDAGVDDASAILLLLRAEHHKVIENKVVAITCVHGNTDEKNVELNVLKTLTIANRTDVNIKD